MISHAIFSFPVSCFVLVITRTPGNSNFSRFPLKSRFELSGVDSIFPQFLVFAVSEESTVECLEGSSDIFGNGRTFSLLFGSLRESSVALGNKLW